MKNDSSSGDTNIEHAYVVVDSEEPPSIDQDITVVHPKSYRGRNRNHRREFEHDLEILPKLPYGPGKDRLTASADTRAAHYGEKGETTEGERRAVRIVLGIVAVSILGGVVLLGLLIHEDESVIAHGHPEYTLYRRWHDATSSFFGGHILSPRGNILHSYNEPVPVDIPSAWNQNHATMTVTLRDITPVKACTNGAALPTSPSGQGEFALVNFDVSTGQSGFSHADLFANDDIYVAEPNGSTHQDIRVQIPGCTPDMLIGTLQAMPANTTRHVHILMEVAIGSGYIGTRLDGDSTFEYEWQY